jgi:hypothetical protein
MILQLPWAVLTRSMKNPPSPNQKKKKNDPVGVAAPCRRGLGFRKNRCQANDNPRQSASVQTSMHRKSFHLLVSSHDCGEPKPTKMVLQEMCAGSILSCAVAQHACERVNVCSIRFRPVYRQKISPYSARPLSSSFPTPTARAE